MKVVISLLLCALSVSSLTAPWSATHTLLIPGLYTDSAFDAVIRELKIDGATKGRFGLEVECSPMLTQKFKFLPEPTLCHHFQIREDIRSINDLISRLKVKAPRDFRGVSEDTNITFKLTRNGRLIYTLKQTFGIANQIPIVQTTNSILTAKEYQMHVNETICEIMPSYITRENKERIRVFSSEPKLFTNLTFSIQNNKLMVTGQADMQVAREHIVDFWLEDELTGLKSPKFTLKFKRETIAFTPVVITMYAVAAMLLLSLFFSIMLSTTEKEDVSKSVILEKKYVSPETQVLSGSIADWSPNKKEGTTCDSLNMHTVKNDTLAEIDLFTSNLRVNQCVESELSFVAEEKPVETLILNVDLSQISERP